MDDVYLLYITVPKDIFLSKVKPLIDNAYDFHFSEDMQSCYGLYGWTKKKSRLHSFLDYRDNDIYKVFKKELDPQLEMLLNEKFPSQELCKRQIFYRTRHIRDEIRGSYDYMTMDELRGTKKAEKDTMEVVLTKNEFVNITIYREENFLEFGPCAAMGYQIFTDEFVDLLDQIGYTTIHDVHWSSNLNTIDMAIKSLNIDDQDFMWSEISMLFCCYDYPVLGSRRSIRTDDESS